MHREEKLKKIIGMRKDLMTDQNFDSKTIRYLYVSMIVAGLAFTGEFESRKSRDCSVICIRDPLWDFTDCFRNKYLFVLPSIFPISSWYWHLCFTISSHLKKFSNLDNLFELNACWFQSQNVPRRRWKTFRLT